MSLLPRVIVARYNPQHSLRLAAALQSAQMLKTYYTGLYTAWDKQPFAMIRWLPLGAKEFVDQHLFQKVQRSSAALDPSLVRVIRPGPNIAMAILFRLGVSQPWEVIGLRQEIIHFERKVAKESDQQADILVLYDTNAYHALVATTNRPIIRVLDLATIHWKARDELYRTEGEAWPQLRNQIPSVSYNLARFAEICAEPTLADYVLVGSEFAKSTCVEHGCDPDRVYVVPYGVDPEAFFPTSRTTECRKRPFRILFVGNSTPLKGFHYLLEMLDRLPNLSMEIWCCGLDGKTSSLGRQTAWDSRIKPLGLVSHHEMANLMRQVDMLFHPSILDSFSLTCLEAMASGLPVLTTPRTGAAELIRHGENGFVVPHGNVILMADQVRTLYSDEALCTEIGRKARITALDYTWRRYETTIEDVFWDITRRSKEVKRS